MADRHSLPLMDGAPQESPFEPATVKVPKSAKKNGVDFNDGVLSIEQPDGGVTINFNGLSPDAPKEDGFYANLAFKIEPGELARIASDLLRDIEADDQSRNEWLETRARGIGLLGLKLEDQRASSVDAPLEGQSKVRHPLLLEAVLQFQANARGELLPAAGPVKVRNDTPIKPDQPDQRPPMMLPSPGPGYPPQQIPQPPDQTVQFREELATALETDFNHYLTVDAPEYYPDTDQMMFLVGFGGLGIKKVYNCPIRRRPVSESIDAKDFIVHDATTDLRNAGRITHRIRMRPSTLKRMQILGAYRDVPLTAGAPFQPNSVDRKIAETQGTNVNVMTQSQHEQPHEIYETYCELDILGFEHKEKGKPTGLRIPYKVTIHKTSQQILEIRRNYEEDDKLCMPKEYFVDYPFARSFGFYPIGLLHILGNSTVALTAAWREMLDMGMFANFPGFLYAKQVGRQHTNNFRVQPGSGLPVDVGMGSIRDAVMPLPYKDVGASFSGFIERIEEVSRRVGGVAEIQIGEGKQEVPVGTTLALIEQATKMMDAVHKRLHAAQQKEFGLLKERFKEDPEAFWRHNKKPAYRWQKDQFKAALDIAEIVPVADPNNPTSLHRIAKATAVKTLQQLNPTLYDSMQVDRRIMRIVGIDPEGLFLPTPSTPPPDPRLEAVKAKAQGQSQQAQVQRETAQAKVQQAMIQSGDKRAQMASQEKIAQMKAMGDTVGQQQKAEMERQLGQQKLAQAQQKNEMDIQAKDRKMRADIQRDMMKAQQDFHIQRATNAMQMQAKQQELRQNAQMQRMQGAQDLATNRMKMQGQMQMDREQHDHSMALQREQGQQKMAQGEMMGQQKFQQSQAANQQKMDQSRRMGKEKVKHTKAITRAKGGGVKE